MTTRFGLLQGKGYGVGAHVARYPLRERSLVRVLRDQAARFGSKPWIVFDGRDTLTFAEAWRRACQAGHALDQVADAGAPVALLLRNQVEFMPAFYGAMVRSGLAVPLNCDSRGVLLHGALAKSAAQVLVARHDLLPVLAELPDLGAVRALVVAGEGELPAAVHGVPVVGWDRWLEGQPDRHGWRLPAYSEPALIQFTSGTTANQKGAVYPHHFLYLYPAMVTDSLERGPDDVLTTPLPLYHVAALHMITNSGLHAGCTVHLKSRFSATQFWAQAAADRATHAILLGPMAAIIAKVTPDPVPEHRMRDMFIVPPPPGMDDFERRFRTKVLWQGYGMTEVYPMPMRKRLLEDKSLDALGHPVQWMEYGVVDEDDELLPPGERGELVFRPRLPHAMVSGYFRDPEKTVEAFRNFMFHTGDLAYYDADGCVHYCGRKQERIRHRGENIAALELELVVLGHPRVVEVAVYGVPSEFGEEDVKLDAVADPGLGAEELRAWLEPRVPRYMLPRYIEFRQSFPKTPSERVQKYHLKDQPLDRAEVFDAERTRVSRESSPGRR